jgi:hypothetical protein
MIIHDLHNNMLKSPVRKFEGRVEVYEGSTLTLTCGCHNALQSFTIERMGEDGKFFGFGVCQKLKTVLKDKPRAINISKSNYLEAVFGVNGDYLYPYPRFHVAEVSRDETSNDLTITAYDDLERATSILITDLGLELPYTIRTLVAACAAALGLPINEESISGPEFDLLFSQGANFNGDENLRKVLNSVAEVTQTIYFINRDWELEFKRLDKDSAAGLRIDKALYFKLNNKETRTLANITHATELGDNVTSTSGAEGVTQYVRDNPFWELQENIAELLEASIARIGGLSISQFDCEWRGNYLLEIGDKIELVTKDNEIITSYALNDAITYNGALSQTSQWEFTDNDAETPSNPTTLGDALNKTFARVDKVNQEIELMAIRVEANSENISNIKLNTDSITASVSQLQESIESSQDSTNEQIETLRNEVSAKMTSEDVSIAIKSELDNGVNKVITNTGFTFNDEGLTVSKSNSEMETTITEDGMTVYKNHETVLTANNEGVKAIDLHAETYLIIGTNSRFEDYGSNRTGCFWIGG